MIIFVLLKESDIHLLIVKNHKPVYFILIGSALTSLLSFLVLFFCIYQKTVNSITCLAVVPLVIGISTFIFFYYLIEKFVSERLKVLYRSIHKEKIAPGIEKTFKLTHQVFEDAENETKFWAEERNQEISVLKEQATFRKEFLGNLAHELKTTLFSIQGYILTLLEGGLEDEKINRVFLERASTSVDRMVNLIEDLDEITKLESNSIKMDMQDFDLKKLTREIIDSLELKAQEKQIKLRFSKEYSSLMVNGDRAKVSQVLTNLINNSINYGNDKGETVIRFHEIDDLILVEISDNGPGIAKKDIPRLFERFYRVEKSRTRNEGGSGLGLAIVKHIVESHNQTINVRSTLGIGSTFSFTLEKANSKDSELVTSKGIKIR